MNWAVGLVALAVVGSTPVPAGAQGASTAVPDSVRAAYRNTLMQVRDSTAVVRGAATRFSRDLQYAGSRTVLNRARRLSAACTNLHATLGDARGMFRPSRVPATTQRQASTLLKQVEELRSALLTNCQNGLAASGPGERADSLRSWGPHHTSRLERQLDAYDDAAAGFAQAMDFKLEPRLP